MEWVKDANSGRTFQLAFVEFTDQGWLHDRAQMERAMSLFERRAGKTQVVTYIHGWQHDASANDSDVRLFRETILPAFARTVDEDTATVGLYVGWRGESSALPGLRYLTFYDRKFTAEHVARGSVRELISRLRAFHDRTTQSTDTHKVVLIGHSFGGLVLYNAMAESLIDRLVRTPPGHVSLPVADLAVVINPAFEASRFEPTFQAALHHGSFDSGRPIFVSITAENDWATGIAFPLGRWINSTFDHEAWTSEDQGPPGRSQDCTLSDDRRECPPYERPWRLEKIANTHTIGHVQRYFTHQLELTGNAASAAVVCRTMAAQPDVVGSRVAASPQAPEPRNAFPLWTMRARPPLVDGHSEIGHPSLWTFLAELSAPQGLADRLCPTDPAP